MRLRALHPPHHPGRINVTPLIDVIMCMIVFYLIVGKLAADLRAPMPLPLARHGTGTHAQDPLFINVVPGEGGPARLIVERVEIAPGDLPALLRLRLADKPATVVHIRADRSLPYGAVAPTVAACREAGIASVRLATEQSP